MHQIYGWNSNEHLNFTWCVATCHDSCIQFCALSKLTVKYLWLLLSLLCWRRHEALQNQSPCGTHERDGLAQLRWQNRKQNGLSHASIGHLESSASPHTRHGSCSKSPLAPMHMSSSALPLPTSQILPSEVVVDFLPSVAAWVLRPLLAPAVIHNNRISHLLYIRFVCVHVMSPFRRRSHSD